MMQSRVAGRDQEYFGAEALARNPEITLPMIAANIHNALNDTYAKVEWTNLQK